MTEPKGTSRIRRGRKFDQVLEGARMVFLRDGYEGASVDEIAHVAGVSKATLYSYFPDKRLLFLEAAKSECARQSEEADTMFSRVAPVREVLTYVGERITAFMFSDFGQAMFRIAVTEAARFPELGREFYESGPLLLRARLAGYLREAAARGELRIDDFDLAADQFAELCKADIHARLLYGVTRKLAPRDARRTVDGAVTMFLACYGTQATASLPVQDPSSPAAPLAAMSQPAGHAGAAKGHGAEGHGAEGHGAEAEQAVSAK